jgi:hypothetical protein
MPSTQLIFGVMPFLMHCWLKYMLALQFSNSFSSFVLLDVFSLISFVYDVSNIFVTDNQLLAQVIDLWHFSSFILPFSICGVLNCNIIQ